jgi:hypothetical protein
VLRAQLQRLAPSAKRRRLLLLLLPQSKPRERLASQRLPPGGLAFAAGVAATTASFFQSTVTHMDYF